MVNQTRKKKELYTVKFAEFAYCCHDSLPGQRVDILVCWRRWIPVKLTVHEKKNQWRPLLRGFRFCFVLLHASIVVVRHCVDGDREGVSVKEREAVQEKPEEKFKQDAAPWSNHTRFCGRVHVYMCVYIA